ncbi:cytoplasmic protein [Rhodococcus qingshengii]|nr:cytoplasmic protein [Rhodococcus qingshengii]
MEIHYKEAHRFSSNHRKDLERDQVCGCFHCLKIFSPAEITEWVDNEATALCPFCGIDSVIGESSGYPITEQFLNGMHKAWF